MQSKRGFFGRLWALWTGFWGSKLKSVEVSNAEAVYHNALQERIRQHDQLKQAVARLVYLRNKIEADSRRKREDLRLVEKALRDAALLDRDEQTLGLLRKQRQLQAEVTRLEAERQRFGEQATKAKHGLQDVVASVSKLKAERIEMLARRSHAMARLQVREALGDAFEAGQIAHLDSALGNVREAIERLEHEAGLSEESEELAEGVSMASLRKEATDAADREALLVLKREVRGRLLPEPERRRVIAINATTPKVAEVVEVAR